MGTKDTKQEGGCFQAIGGLVIIIVIVWIVGSLFGGGDDYDTNNITEDVSLSAFLAAEKCVKRELGRPSKVVWVGNEYKNQYVHPQSDGQTYKVLSSVKFTNERGERLEYGFECDVIKVNGKWECTFVEFNPY